MKQIACRLHDRVHSPTQARNDKLSSAPEMLGLPALTPNEAEGYVLKPARRAPVSSRATAKRKIAGVR